MGIWEWFFGEDMAGDGQRGYNRGEQIAGGSKKKEPGWLDLDYDEELALIHRQAEAKKEGRW